jgi:uncharacterized membrane protein
MRRRVVIYIVCLVLAILISGSIIMAPLLITAGGFASRWGAVMYLACSGLCHQDPERSYTWHGIQMAVCHRCIGTYAGALLGLLVYPFTPHFKKGAFPSLTTFLIFTLPVGIDLFLGTIGAWDGHPYVRTITGAMVAFIGVFYAVPGLDEMIDILAGRKRKAEKPDSSA